MRVIPCVPQVIGLELVYVCEISEYLDDVGLLLARLVATAATLFARLFNN
jgi:hypothetical protein